jgi:PAS domain S-box-containing protein
MNQLKEQQNEDFFNIVNDAITVHDADFNIIHANDCARELLGLKLKTILSEKCFKSYHGTNCPPELCPSCSVLKTGDPSSSEVFEPYLNKHIEIRAFPRFDKKGKLIGLLHIVRDVSARKQMEDELKQSVSKLTAQAKELEASNIAFKHLLTQRENDKKDLEEDVLSNIRLLVLPYIERLKMNRGMSEELTLINELETNIKSVISPFSHKLSSEYFGLSPKEIKLANLIRAGNQDKDISGILNIALETVKTHRHNIRKKLNLNGKKTNLMTYLLSLD